VERCELEQCSGTSFYRSQGEGEGACKAVGELRRVPTLKLSGALVRRFGEVEARGAGVRAGALISSLGGEGEGRGVPERWWGGAAMGREEGAWPAGGLGRP
jgi:hypothetical protein